MRERGIFSWTLAKRAALGLTGACLLLGFVGWLALRCTPLPAALFTPPPGQREFLDRHGEPLRVIRAGENPFHQNLSYAEIPERLVQATLAAEDRRFWHHAGVDWRASVRALWQFARHRRVVSGGSTITQQLVKLAAPRPRTLRTKLIEAAQAMRLEQVWSKQQILAAYLDRLDYGNGNRGAAVAAEFYFSKPVRDLTAAECALLASLPQAPSRLNPLLHPEAARKRQQWVLGRMHAAGWLAGADYQRARSERILLVAHHRPFAAPHFVDLLLRQGAPGSGTVRTTLDLELHRVAENALRRHLAGLRAHDVSNGAVVILDNRQGDVLALVGSENYFAPGVGQVNGAWALRSPGSALKPFTYLLAFESGASPASVVADVPVEFATPTGLFAPVNYDRHCYGPMRYRLALANSLNISAVRVLVSAGGAEALKRRLQNFGLTTLSRPAEHFGLGLTIGNAEVRLLELANAYACLGRLGRYQPYRLLLPPRTVSTASGCQVADPAAAYLVADVLSDNDARTPAFGTESPLRFDFQVACKTGTSSDFRDNWAFGYTPEFTVGVWVGNFDGRPMHDISGVAGAAPTLHELFEYLHRRYGTTWYVAPDAIVECSVNPLTGKRLAGAEPFPPGRDVVVEKVARAHLPPVESRDDYDPQGRVRLAREYRAWMASSDNWAAGRVSVPPTGPGGLRILFPVPGTTVYLDPDLPNRGRRLRLVAEGPGHAQWQSESLQVVQEGGRTLALLTEGRHALRIRDPQSGAQAETWIQVLNK